MGDLGLGLRRWVCGATVCCAVWLAGQGSGAALAAPPSNPVAEAWVMQQVEAGLAADLGLRFPSESDRVLGARFTEDLLAGTLPDVRIPRQGVRIRNAIWVDPIDLENAEISHEVRLEACRFEGELNLSQSRWQRDLSLAGSAFTGVRLNRMKTDGSVVLKNATFAGLAAFMNAEIAGQFQVDGAQFADLAMGAVFDGLRVGGAALFNHVTFSGPVSFVSAAIGGQFQAEGAQFTDPKQTANFNGLTVGGIAWFSKSTFAGPVDFRGASIGGQLFADEAYFNSPDQAIVLKGMKVNNAAFFRRAAFAGPILIADAEFLDLFIDGTQKDAPQLDLSRTVVRRDLRVENLTLHELTATSIRVGGTAYFGGLRIGEVATLEHGSFLALTFHDVSWPGRSAAFRLDGISYQALNVESGDDSRGELLALADRSAYSSQVYAGLEEYFRRLGDVSRANEVYVAQRRRDRADNLAWTSFDWGWNLFLDVFVLYGRGPGRAFLWSAFLVAIGWAVFRRVDGMRMRRLDLPPEGFSPFWYSLDLFLPFLDLQVASLWEPRPERRLARHYARLHALLGWLLIPVGLLALTGIVK